MADLIDRLTFDEAITGRPHIPSHTFSSYLGLYAFGLIADKADIVTAWDLQGDEATQANAIATEIDGLATAQEKHRFYDRVLVVVHLLNAGDQRYSIDRVAGTLNKTLVQTDLGI